MRWRDRWNALGEDGLIFIDESGFMLCGCSYSVDPSSIRQRAVWGLLKGKLANGRPDNLHELEEQPAHEFRQLSHSQPKLRGCILQSELPFCLP
jgi:hypothetical protein